MPGYNPPPSAGSSILTPAQLAQGDSRYAALVSGVKQVDTVAALRLTTGAAGHEFRFLRGYYGTGTGGGGIFRADASDTTTADNGITVFVDASGMRWKREWDGTVLTPQCAGCKIDDSTNDSTNAQALVDFLSARGGGTILLTPGTMLANIVIKENVTIYGPHIQSMPSTGLLCKMRGVSGSTGWVIDTPSATTNTPHVVGVDFHGNGTTVLGGVRFQDVHRGAVKYCAFDNFGENAIKKVAGYACHFEENFAQNCLLNRARTQVDGVIDIDGTDDWIMGGEYTASILPSAGTGWTSYVTESGTAQAGASTTITLRSGARSSNTAYGGTVRITGGTGSGQTRYISSYNGSTKVLTVSSAWTTNPDATSTYSVYGPLSDTAQAGGSNTLTLSTNESSNNSQFNGFICEIVSGTGVGQQNLITGYVGSTRVATMLSNWTLAPDNTSVYRIYPVRCAAVVMRGTNSWTLNTVGELSDCGFYFASSTSPGNRVIGARADLNACAGMVLAGIVTAQGAESSRSCQNANGIYDGFVEVSQAQSLLVGCKSTGLLADTAKPRYGFNHSTAAGNSSKLKNIAPVGDSANQSGLIHQYNDNSAGVFIPPGTGYFHTTGGTIPLDGYSMVRIASALTITDITGSFYGQEIVIYAGASGIVLTHNSGSGSGAKFSLPGSVNMTLTIGNVYRFVNIDGALRMLRDGGAQAKGDPSTLKPDQFSYTTIDREKITQVSLGALTSGVLNLAAIYLPAGITITSIGFVSGTTALAGGTNQWFALFDGSRNLIGTTSDDTSTAWTAGAVKLLALGTPYVTPSAGRYYLGINVVATTMPNLSGLSPSNTLLNLTPRLAGSSNTGLTNPASAPATATNPVGNNIYAFAGVV